MMEELFVVLCAYLLIGYLIGSIPFGLILTKIFLKKDVREIGSGNIGATNVLRTGSKLLAFLTLALDASKGAFVILLLDTREVETYIFGGILYLFTILAGFAAIIGHCYPVWLKFKGGKGVSTALGVLLAAVPYAGLAAAAGWILTLLITRISSASALAACAVAPIATFFIYGSAPAVIVLLISLLIALRHKDNIKRLIKGEEPKIGKKKGSDEPAAS